MDFHLALSRLKRQTLYFCLAGIISLMFVGCAQQPAQAVAPPAPAKAKKSSVSNAQIKRTSPRQDAAGAVANSFPGSIVWRWTGWSQNGQVRQVAQPERYTLQLLANGWFKIKADCHTGEGMYETLDAKIVMIVTREGGKPCGKQSQSRHFVEMLESVTHMRMGGNSLWLDRSEEGSSMRFER